MRYNWHYTLAVLFLAGLAGWLAPHGWGWTVFIAVYLVTPDKPR